MATDVAVSLPAVSVQGGNVYTVTLDQAAAKITSLVIHAWQDTPEQVLQQVTVAPLFVYGPNE